MSDIPFHRTPMGQRFYEVTASSIAREVGRLNDNRERLLVLLDRPAFAREAAAPDANPGAR